MNIAAPIVETVSGMPYEDFLQERLFDPLGMAGTTFWAKRRANRPARRSLRTEQGARRIREERTTGYFRLPAGAVSQPPGSAGGGGGGRQADGAL